MAYVTTNFRTKKALKEAVKAGEIVYLQQNMYGTPWFSGNKAVVEGPWYPEPHRWYANVTTDDRGKVLTVK
jgi:hypothetical protein